jgi:hypothetical protein
MFNLYEILRHAQGGHALENLATQFGITTEEADTAVKAIVPTLSAGFLKQASEPHAFCSFIGALGEGQHLAAFTDPAAAQATATAQKGGDILSQILGSHNAREEIAVRASSATGISQDTLAKMLPVIASMIFGGLINQWKIRALARSSGNSPTPLDRAVLARFSAKYWAAGGVRRVRGNRRRPLRARPEEGKGGLAVFGVHLGKSY